MTALLEVNGVTKRFGGLVAVSDVSFTLAEGEILGLIGPNGAGKTTLFNMVNGVYKLNSGKISFAGQDITNRPPNQVVHLGIARTHQIVKPLYGMTVLENVTVGACFGRDYLRLIPARKVALEVLERVGLADRAEYLGALAHHRGQEAPGSGARSGGASQAASAGRGAGRAESHRGRDDDRDRARHPR